MKFSLVTVVAVLAAAVAAEGLDAREVAGTPAKCDKYAKMVPTCARGCIKTAAKKSGCGATNYTCECKKKSAIQKAATPCVLKKCSSSDAQKTLAAVQKVCNCVNGS